MPHAKLVLVLFGVLAFQSLGEGQTQRDKVEHAANPIRRVVTMLQMMQKKITAEGEKEKELYEAFMCYCKNGKADLTKAVADANVAIPDAKSEIEEIIALIAQLEGDVAHHEKDRKAAKDAIAEATEIRKKEHTEFLKGKEAAEAQIALIKKMMAAIGALEKGAYGLTQAEFLQQHAGAAAMNEVRSLVVSDSVALSDFDRDSLTSFLSQGSGEAGGEDYTPQSGEIIGILKQMADEMAKNLHDGTAAETKKVNTFQLLLNAKLKEIDALTKLIEEKLKRLGELKVKLVDIKEGLSDDEAALVDNSLMLKNIDNVCDAKRAEYELRVKTRGEELLAIADTIKILNDDDALDLFKKTLPSASLMQVPVREGELRARALALVQQVRHSGHASRRSDLGFLALALSGKKVSFDKVIKMIDDMVALLKEEQTDDDSKKEYCQVTIDHTEDKFKALEHDIADLTTSIDDMTTAIATLGEEIKALEEGIVALDKSVAEATVQRKEENEDYTNLMASDTAAQQLLEMAKNRLNKFYNPKLYKPPPTTPAPDAFALAQEGAKDPVVMKPPPETWGKYSKKGEESNSVIGMIDDLKKDLEVEMAEATAEEKNSQEEYEELMRDSAAKRATDTKSIASKTAEKAATESDLVEAKSEKTDKTKEMMATEKFLGTLHLECDWLMKNYALRAEARAGEVDALSKAKAVLSGADYSFVQGKTRLLRGANHHQ
jgi:hypothetical protein